MSHDRITDQDAVDCFECLWRDAFARRPFDTVCTLLRVSGLQDADWDPLEESEQAFRDFNWYLSANSDELSADAQWRIGLLMYCQAVEISAVHSMLANLLRILLGQRYHLDPLASFGRADKKRRFKWYPPSAKVKWSKIRNMAEEVERLDLVRMIDAVYNDEVRNAFSHSDYIITDTGFRWTEGGLPQEMPREQLSNLVANAFSFFAVFMAVRDRWLKVVASMPRYHKWPDYDVLELLKDTAGRLSGFCIHFSNGNSARFARTADVSTARTSDLRKTAVSDSWWALWTISALLGSFMDALWTSVTGTHWMSSSSSSRRYGGMLRTARVKCIATLTATAALIAIAHAQEISTRVQQPPPTERQTDPGENRNDIQDQETPPTRQDGEGAIIEHPEAGDDRVTTEPDRGDQEQLAWLLRHIDDIRLTDALLIGLTALLVIFTGLLALFTLRLWRATAGLWEAAKEQSRDMKASIAVAEAANELNRENMVASRRAWISIEEVHLKHPTTFTEDGLRFAIDVMIKNHGQTPATSVEIVVESHFARTSGEVFPQAESKFKSRLRSHRIELGHMLFPHDELKEGTHWIDGIDKIKDSIRTLPSGERVIDFTVFIGVSYRIIGDKDVHITYCPHGGLNVPIGTTIPAGQLVDLPREPFLAGETD